MPQGLKPFFVYVLASRKSGTLYTGMTDDLGKRIEQHRSKSVRGFTKKYDVTRLVWFERHDTREGAFIRERQIKEWKRSWKIELIEEFNPGWNDLFETMNLG